MTAVRVVGAGISGLAAAWFLAERGATVEVVEAAPGPGGLIQTRREPEGLVEAAARAFTWSPRTAALFAAAGIEPLPTENVSARRFVYRHGKPRRWPLSPIETAGLAAHAGAAWARRAMKARRGESVAQWGERVIGRPGTRWLLAPMLQGIYASPPDTLSATAIFGARTGRGGRLIAPPDGMGQLMTQLAAVLTSRGVSLRYGVTATTIDRGMPTVLCTSAPAAARLLAPIAPAIARALSRIRMVSLLTVTSFYPLHPSDVHGFGILFPRDMGIRALGVLFNADIFQNRSDVRSETWIYGDLDASALPSTASSTLTVAADRLALTGRDTAPIACYPTPQLHALPLYDDAVTTAIETVAAEPLPRGVAIAGNFLGRLGVSKLIEGAADAADAVVFHHLRN